MELLRDPRTGALASTARCVWKVTDRVRLETPAARTAAPARQLVQLRPYLALGYLDGLEGGIGADVFHLGDVSLGADLRIARIGAGQAFQLGLHHVNLGASLPLAVGGHVRGQLGYGISLNRCTSPGVPTGCTSDAWGASVTLRF